MGGRPGTGERARARRPLARASPSTLHALTSNPKLGPSFSKNHNKTGAGCGTGKGNGKGEGKGNGKGKGKGKEPSDFST